MELPFNKTHVDTCGHMCLLPMYQVMYSLHKMCYFLTYVACTYSKGFNRIKTLFLLKQLFGGAVLLKNSSCDYLLIFIKRFHLPLTYVYF